VYVVLQDPLTNDDFSSFFPVQSSIYYSAYADRPYPDPYLAAASGIGPVAGYGAVYRGSYNRFAPY